MVAATPICNSIFSAILGASGYNQTADAALGTAGQTLATQQAISIGYIWIETIGFAVCALLILAWNVEDKLQEEQRVIAERKKK